MVEVACEGVERVAEAEEVRSRIVVVGVWMDEGVDGWVGGGVDGARGGLGRMRIRGRGAGAAARLGSGFGGVRFLKMGGEACECGGGAACLGGGGGIHDASEERPCAEDLVLSRDDAGVAVAEGFESVEGFQDEWVFGESEKGLGRELVLGEEIVDVAVELDEVGEEQVVRRRVRGHVTSNQGAGSVLSGRRRGMGVVPGTVRTGMGVVGEILGKS